nr:MAG TPA: hypothetical protein [Caudoviricetes sp.]
MDASFLFPIFHLNKIKLFLYTHSIINISVFHYTCSIQGLFFNILYTFIPCFSRL